MSKYYTALVMHKNSTIEVGDMVIDLTDMRVIRVTEIYQDKNMDGEYEIMIGDDESASNRCVRVKMGLYQESDGKFVGWCDETADWIKEDMEFEEDDIKGLMWAGNRDRYGFVMLKTIY